MLRGDSAECEHLIQRIVNAPSEWLSTPRSEVTHRLACKNRLSAQAFLGSQRMEPCQTLLALKAHLDAVFRLHRAESLETGQSELELLAERLRGGMGKFAGVGAVDNEGAGADELAAGAGCG